MPYIDVKWIGPISDQVKKAVAEGITDVVEKKAGKAREHVWITFSDYDKKNWMFGGKTL